MKLQKMGTLAVTALLAIGIMAPTVAQKKDKDDGDKGRIKVNVVIGNTPDEIESRAFQSWFGMQSRRYKDMDRDTGERTGDLLQMVTDVARGSFTVIDQRNERHTILVSRNTDFACEYDRRRQSGRFEPSALSANAILRRGDLVVVLGYLRSSGDIAATRIRIVGQAGGWFGYDDYRTFDGRRAWGEVLSSDGRSGNIAVNANIGRRTVTLGRDGDVLLNGRRVSLDAMRRGDRVVFYFNDERPGGIAVAYRIVVLRAEDRYPEGDRPHWADPDFRDNPWDDTDRDYAGSVIEGRLQALGNGLFFNRIAITSGGRTLTIHLAKSMEVFDHDGIRIPTSKLREGQLLRITYTDVDGNYFAKRIEVR